MNAGMRSKKMNNAQVVGHSLWWAWLIWCSSLWTALHAMPPDTIVVAIPADTLTSLCLDSTVLEIEGPITGASFCASGSAATVQAINLSGACLDLVPASGFVGPSPDTICTLHCYEQNLFLCDTTWIVVNVSGQGCSPLFSTDSVVVPFSGNPMSVCAPLALSKAIVLELILDGQYSNQPLGGCDGDSLVAYSYAILPGLGNVGPYELVSWQVNGVSFSGFFNNIDELVALLNILDPAGAWMYNPLNLTISGGAPNSQYGNMLISQIQTGQSALLMTNFTIFFNGTEIQLINPGVHPLVAIDTTTGCADTLLIVVTGQLPTTSFVYDSVYVQGVLPMSCADTTQITWGISNTSLCYTPAWGTITDVDGPCVTYQAGLQPAIDTFCLLACDGGNPAWCDTTFFVLTLLPRPDTVVLSMLDTTVLDTCLLGFIELSLAEPAAHQEVCADTSSPIAQLAFSDLGCMQLQAHQSGQDTFCLRFCDSTFCDTVVLVLEVMPAIPPCGELLSNDTLLAQSWELPYDFCLSANTTWSFTLNGQSIFPDSCAGGVSLAVPSFGLHLLIVADSLGCTDSLWLQLDAVPPPDTLGIEYLITLVDEPIDTICASTSSLGGAAQMLGFCALPQHGSAQVLSDSCISYLPQPSFTGFDSLCIVVCDGLVPQRCDSTRFVIRVQPRPDSLWLSTPQNEPTTPVCLDTAELVALFDTAMVCQLPQDGQLLIAANCFTWLPDNGFVGMDSACLAVCDTMGFCDTTWLFLSVGAACANWFSTDTLSAMLSDCQATYELCLPISLDSLLYLQLSLDGQPFLGPFIGCQNDTFFTYTFFNVPGQGSSGPYVLDEWTVDGQLFSGSFDHLTALVDSMNLWDPQGQWIDSMGLFIIGGAPGRLYGNMSITHLPTNASAVVEANIIVYPTGTAIQLDTGQHLLIVADTAAHCYDTLYLDLRCPTPCTYLNLSPDTLMLDDCDSLAAFCIDVPLALASQITWTDNGETFAGPILACDSAASSTAVWLDTGMHQLVLLDTTLGCIDSFELWVGCLSENQILVDTFLPQGQVLAFCFDDWGIDQAALSSLDTCEVPEGLISWEVDPLTGCVVIEGLLPGNDSMCLQLYQGTVLYTIHLFVEVASPCMPLFSAPTVGAGIDCMADTSGYLCLSASLMAMQHKLIYVNGVQYQGPVVGCNFDSTYSINYSLLPNGGQLGPYTLEMWTVNGQSFSGTFNNVEELVDSMNIWDPAGQWVWSEQNGNIAIFGGVASNTYGPLVVVQQLTGAEAVLGVSAAFVPLGTAVDLPLGTHTLQVVDTLTGCRDTLVTTVACMGTDTVCLEQVVGQIDTLCLLTAELQGTLVEQFDVCPMLNGTTAVFALIDSCVIVEAYKAGSDTACIVLCDDLGLCDTTIICTQVPQAGDTTLIARPDTVTTLVDEPVIIDVQGNDFFAQLDTFFIASSPQFGTLTLMLDGTVAYVPDEGYCNDELPDSFSYVICQSARCDTAQVFIWVACTGITVFNGFSPNEDGINDTFVIKGLDKFPNHRLWVYNRWGNVVFEATQYQNDWDGTWKGVPLPDGVYFYLLDDGEGNRYSGYVQIQR